MGVAWKESTLEGLCPSQYSEGGGSPVHAATTHYQLQLIPSARLSAGTF